MNHIELAASLRATNNGYLFAPTAPELACARAHPELFIITGRGTIAPRGFVFEQYPVTPAKVSHARNYDLDFDWEGAILDRQAYLHFD